MTAVPKLPQRTRGVALAELHAAPAPANCAACANGPTCIYHWSLQHLGETECGCCYGRYSSCRNLPEPRTLVQTVEHLLNTLGVRESAQQRQNQQRQEEAT